MKLKYQWPLAWCLLFMIPIRNTLALSATDNTLWQHLLWPLVHANILHWALNTLGFMALWRVVTLPHLLWGYAASVAIGYLWCWCSASTGFASCMIPDFQFSIFNSQLKLCGISCIVFFLLGIIFVRSRKRFRLRLAILITVSCFIPNIAASVHILALLCGIICYRCECWFFRQRNYIVW